ncbi:ABC transporter [Cellvibrio zantedeschiae]|uniref:ABC transporter n=1 Tax=Cellvibrio zantedeschiae TaxID=1237077 RepID=A0ABQ3B9I3_9GAMM|nr:ABC transporter ATP-binding protein [Cellvibrio zantedeschiae]GGY83800.1 ABC transporter [Cellvibrio zantedeschiae]
MQNAIELEQVSKRYSSFYLEHLSLQMPAGQIMGLVGVNGAGKSTILRMLMGLIQPDTGSVNVLGYRLPEQQVLAKENIGFASEDMRLYKSENLRWHMQFIQSIFPSWDYKYAEHLLKIFDLNAEQKLKGFSHGQRVKACLLLILARKPKLLILDEPTTGLDPVARYEVLSELAEVLRDEDRSVLFSSHNTQDVEQLSDSITFLHKGKLLASQDKESYLESWRRIVCSGDINGRKIELPGLAMQKSNGSLHELKVKSFNEFSLGKLQAQGLEVSQVEPMSLEQIFVASVKEVA